MKTTYIERANTNVRVFEKANEELASEYAQEFLQEIAQTPDSRRASRIKKKEVKRNHLSISNGNLHSKK